jgi:deoxyribonuclease-4
LIEEIQLAAQLKLPFLVLHPGAHLGAGEERGLAQVVQGLDEVFRVTSRLQVKIALEITAGQGTCMGHKLEHLAWIIAHAAHPARLGICLDTAHLFAAGYAIQTPKGWNALVKKADELIGLKHILAFHMNDSQTALGSRVDRHAHIGKGKIGLEGFRHIVRDKRFQQAPACLETPKSKDLHEDMENLKILRTLAGVIDDLG